MAAKPGIGITSVLRRYFVGAFFGGMAGLTGRAVAGNSFIRAGVATSWGKGRDWINRFYGIPERSKRYFWPTRVVGGSLWPDLYMVSNSGAGGVERETRRPAPSGASDAASCQPLERGVFRGARGPDRLGRAILWVGQAWLACPWPLYAIGFIVSYPRCPSGLACCKRPFTRGFQRVSRPRRDMVPHLAGWNVDRRDCGFCTICWKH